MITRCTSAQLESLIAVPGNSNALQYIWYSASATDVEDVVFVPNSGALVHAELIGAYQPSALLAFVASLGVNGSLGYMITRTTQVTAIRQ